MRWSSSSCRAGMRIHSQPISEAARAMTPTRTPLSAAAQAMLGTIREHARHARLEQSPLLS